MTSDKWFSLALMLGFGITSAGCGEKGGAPSAESGAAGPGEANHAGEAHDHPSTGPHGGELIELGEEEYHAELVHENDVTVYFLDGSAKSAAPIEAAEIVINVSHDGKAEQFRLTAQGDAGDPAGKSSRFVSSDAELLADVKGEDAEVELVVAINGKQYRGALEHEHGEEGHDH